MQRHILSIKLVSGYAIILTMHYYHIYYYIEAYICKFENETH